MGHVTIDSPGHRLHGKKANVFHKHEDGRVNVQIRHSNRKGDVTNLTLKPNQFKMNEEVELDEANAMQMASAIEAYAKKHGGIDKGDMMKVASMLKKGDMKGAEKYTMRLDSDPRDFLLSKMGFNEATEDIHSHRVGDEIVLKNKNYRGVVKKVSGSDISFENKSDNKHYKATHSMIDRNLSQENRYKEKSDAKNKKFDDAMDSDMKRIHKSGALKKFGIGMNEQMANAPFDPPYSKSTGTHTDKSGAKHGPMSTAKHLARMALAKQARTPAKKNDERKTSIVREALVDAKKRDAKKKDEKKMDGSNNDKFQADPELTTQKLNNF